MSFFFITGAELVKRSVNDTTKQDYLKYCAPCNLKTIQAITVSGHILSRGVPLSGEPCRICQIPAAVTASGRVMVDARVSTGRRVSPRDEVWTPSPALRDFRALQIHPTVMQSGANVLADGSNPKF